MSGTRRKLFRCRILLVAVTVLTMAGALLAIDLGRRDADTLRSGLAPAREGLAAAGESLVAADTKAIIRFDGLACECARLNRRIAAGDMRGDPEQQKDYLTSAGPGVEYRTAINAAGQQLTRVSQADIGGAAVEGVQVVNGLLITYDSLIEQAFRGEPTSLLSRAYMQYAHNFLRSEVLAQLTKVQGDVEDAAPRKPAYGRHLLWAVPLAALLVLLAGVQVWHSGRFRRTLSAPLLLAMCLAVVFGGIAVMSLDVDRDLGTGRSALEGLAAAYETRGDAANGAACAALYRVSRDWPAGWEGCPTSDPDTPECPASRSAVPSPKSAPAGTTDPDLLTVANSVSTTAQSANTSASRAMIAILALGLLIGSLITLGLMPRIDEYRFRRR